MQTRPDYLVIGHVAKDLRPDGTGADPGGTATYSAITAQRLGLQAAIVTTLAPEDDYLLDDARSEGVWVHAVPSGETTTFKNTYDAEGHRTQLLPAHAISITPDSVPSEWRSVPIVHLGPVAQELPPEIVNLFPGSMVGATPQGWIRSWDTNGRVSHNALPVPEALRNLPAGAVIVLSMEDIGFEMSTLPKYTVLADTVVVTQSAGEALIFRRGEHIGSVPACHASPVDPTGAGDVFATAFLIRLQETSDPMEAARFAHAAAAIAIEGPGTKSIANRQETKDRLLRNS